VTDRTTARKPAGARRALSIGVSQFPETFAELPYAATLAAALRAELGVLGYACGDPVATDWTSRSLGDAVRETIGSASAADVLIVHVLTHGKVSDDTGKLYVVGTDGQHYDFAGVESWLTAVQDGQDPPLVLFVLDICEAGTAARLPWQGATADGSARAWVIAACGPQEQAFNGWLTQATTTVLRRLRAGDLDIDPSVEFVPLPKVAQEIRAEVRRLAKDEGDGLTQQVTGTQLDISVDPPTLPFFKNPAFAPKRPVALPPETDPALASFTDGIREPTPSDRSATGQATTGRSRSGTPGADAPAPGTARADQPSTPDGPSVRGSDREPLPGDADLSPGYWSDRAGGYGPIPASLDAGCFTGRLDQLNQLVPWVQGWTPGHGARTLSVVTGGPGVGKSALLGVLVCAAHPALRDATRPLWSEARQTPPEITQLTAVHARQRDLADVTACLARQLTKVLTPRANPRPAPADEAGAQAADGVGGPVSAGAGAQAADGADDPVPDGADGQVPDASRRDAHGAQPVPADPAGLVAALAAADAGQPVPVIVLDALDESIGAQAIIDELILPLVAARRPDAAPACRVLVGTRRHGFERLLEAAAAQRGLIDLDQADRTKLVDDLNGYVVKLLRTQPAYRTMAAVRGAFAEELASALSRPPDGDRRWGEFLIAGLYTHSFLRATAAAPVSSADEAGSRGAACPRTLPAVLDLDLETRENARDLRQVLQIVALAKGDGMPASVIDRARPRQPLFGAYTSTLRALSELGFYLRRANDEDGTTLYRVFHEGLADELRPRAETTDDPAEILLRASLSAWEPAWSHTSAEAAILAAMLSELGPESARRWDLAEPYVLRHALDHAQAAHDPDARDHSPGILVLDPEFLVHADPSVIGTLARLDTETERMMDAPAIFQLFLNANAALLHLGGDLTAVLEDIRALALAAAEPPAAEAATRSPAAPQRRRAALALAAARLAAPALAAALAEPPAGSPESPLPWQPRWTAGHRYPASMMREGFWPPTSINFVEGVPSALTAGVVNGEPSVITGTTQGRIEVRAIADGHHIGRFDTSVRPSAKPTGQPRAGTTDSFAIEAPYFPRPPKGSPVPAGGGEWDAYIARYVKVTNRTISAIGISQGTAAVSIGLDGIIGSTRLSAVSGLPAMPVPPPGQMESTHRLRHPHWFVALEAASVAGRTLVAATDTEAGIEIIDLASGESLKWIKPENAAVTAHIDGRRYHLVRYSSLPEISPNAPYDGLRVTVSDDNHLGDLVGHAGYITTITTMTLDGRPVAVTASLDGTVRFWDVPAQREIERLDLPGPVQTVAPLGDHLAVLCCGEVIVYARRAPGQPGRSAQ
jgi:hypothetical protein